MSKEMIVVVDEAKNVPLLGKFPLPVEIAPFAANATIKALNAKGYFGMLRSSDNLPFITDNQHYIYDISFPTPIDNPEYHENILINIPGVITTGFFFHLAGRVLIGSSNGRVKIIE